MDALYCIIRASSNNYVTMDKPAPTATRLLIATDDSAWIASVSHSLSAHGFLVRIATNGQTALESLLTERFEFVIAALRMPKLDGIGLVKEIRKSHFLRHLPVLIVGHDEGTTPYERAITVGADDYVELPINNELLRLKVQGISNRAKRMDALFEASLIGRFNPRQFSDIVQLLNTTNRSGLLRIFSGPSVTQLWFRGGVLTFARDEMEDGIQAVYNLVKASDARFEFIEGERLNASNISRSQMYLLLEFSRKLDTYVVSRKQTINSELGAAKENFNALLESGAQKYIPYIASKCVAMISSGESLLNDDNVEEASLVVRKLEDTLKWISVELDRVKKAIDTVSMGKRRTKGVENAAPKTEAVEESKEDNLEVADTVKAEAPKEQAAEILEQTATAEPKLLDKSDESDETDELGSRETVRISNESGKQDGQEEEGSASENNTESETAAQEETVDGEAEPEVKSSELVEEAVLAKAFSLLPAPAQTGDTATERVEHQGGIPDFVILDEDALGVADEPAVAEPVTKKTNTRVIEKKPAVPRLIQRFPPDVVEMMQVELAKFSGTILNPRAMKEFRNRLNNGPVASTMTLQSAGRLLSEAYYSQANVLSVVIYGNAAQLRDFFSNMTGTAHPEPGGECCLITRLAGGLDHALYIIGLQYSEMDSFEAETILERAMGAIILGLEDSQLEDLQIDALSLALVKFRRHRVMMLYREGMLSQKIGTALSRYSLDNSKKRTDFDFSRSQINRTLDLVLESFTN